MSFTVLTRTDSTTDLTGRQRWLVAAIAVVILGFAALRPTPGVDRPSLPHHAGIADPAFPEPSLRTGD